MSQSQRERERVLGLHVFVLTVGKGSAASVAAVIIYAPLQTIMRHKCVATVFCLPAITLPFMLQLSHHRCPAPPLTLV